MPRSFNTNQIIRLFLPVFLISMAFIAYDTIVTPPVNGGVIMQIGLATFFIAFTVGGSWLYIRSGLLVYRVTDDGLELRRLIWRRIVPWHEIKEITLNESFHYVTLRNADGVICFSSTDYFTRLHDLLFEIHQHSNCAMPDTLWLSLYGGLPVEKGLIEKDFPTHIPFDKNNEWHNAVNMMLTIDCHLCGIRFISPSRGIDVAAGDDAALVEAEAQTLGWTMAAAIEFQCPKCTRQTGDF